MKKILFLGLFLTLLTGCVDTNAGSNIEITELDYNLNGYIVFSIKTEAENRCTGFSEFKVFEEEYTYRYFYEDCMGDGLKVKDEEEYIFLSEGLKKGLFTREDILETDLGAKMVLDTDDDKTVNRQALMSEYDVESDALTYIASYRDIHYYHINTLVCDAEVSFERSGYDFYVSSGCDDTLDDLQIVAVSGGRVFGIEELIEDNKLHVDTFYHNVYVFAPYFKLIENQ